MGIYLYIFLDISHHLFGYYPLITGCHFPLRAAAISISNHTSNFVSTDHRHERYPLSSFYLFFVRTSKGLRVGNRPFIKHFPGNLNLISEPENSANSFAAQFDVRLNFIISIFMWRHNKRTSCRSVIASNLYSLSIWAQWTRRLDGLWSGLWRGIRAGIVPWVGFSLQKHSCHPQICLTACPLCVCVQQQQQQQQQLKSEQ